MPTSEAILQGIASITNSAQLVASAWHFLLGALILALALGWRPSNRRLGQLLAAPSVSVSVVAWMSGNPFNAAIFAIVAAILVLVARKSSRRHVRMASPTLAGAGAMIVAYGWVYPHFLVTDTWVAYLYASPFGIIPCPTLAVVIGLTLVFSNLQSKAWGGTLVVTGLFYGVFGVLGLGVTLDYGLLAGAIILGGALLIGPARRGSVRATREEKARGLPGDELIPQPLASITHAVTIRRRAGDVWPWIIQVGAGARAGWYSYDMLDNGRRPSAKHIVPELQQIVIGTIFPALPGITEGFTVLGFESAHFLILGWLSADARPLVTWTFVLDQRGDDATRLIVRARGASDYQFRGLPSRLSKYIGRATHDVMQRKQLLGIVRRAEQSTFKEGQPDSSTQRRDAA